MAKIEVHADRVVIQLTASEKGFALRRRDVVIERAAITSALITDDPWLWIRGVRSPGVHVPGQLAMGTWRHLGGRDFVLARSKRRAVVIDIDADETRIEGEDAAEGAFSAFSRVILSTAHAADLISALRLEDGGKRTHTTD